MVDGATNRRVTKVATIVIADDHEVARAGLRSVLTGERDLRVVGEACTGREALALCQRLQPDLVLMDVRMPDMSGLSVTRALKRESPRICIVLFTMYESTEYVLSALRAGAAAYLLKGARKDEILKAVRQVISGELLLHPELVHQLLSRMCSSRESAPLAMQLTPREREVLRLVALGQTNREIAQTLGMRSSTAKTHVEHLIAKLGVSDRTQAAIKAVESGLISSA
jgi:DNA-binding NarL/FixJ family response regulator